MRNDETVSHDGLGLTLPVRIVEEGHIITDQHGKLVMMVTEWKAAVSSGVFLMTQKTFDRAKAAGGRLEVGEMVIEREGPHGKRH